MDFTLKAEDTLNIVVKVGFAIVAILAIIPLVIDLRFIMPELLILLAIKLYSLSLKKEEYLESENVVDIVTFWCLKASLNLITFALSCAALLSGLYVFYSI